MLHMCDGSVNYTFHILRTTLRVFLFCTSQGRILYMTRKDFSTQVYARQKCLPAMPTVTAVNVIYESDQRDVSTLDTSTYV